MKTLSKNVRVEIVGLSYKTDIILAAYHTSKRPAILLSEARPADLPGEQAWLGEPLLVASTNAPEGYIQHLPRHYFAAKSWSENEGLWEQLELLRDEHGDQLFQPTTTSITLGFVRSKIYTLSPWAITLYEDLIAHLPHDYKEQA